MRLWFDTEFMEDGRTIELLSIGIVREDGAEYYAEPAEADHAHANDWVKVNVLPHLQGAGAAKWRWVIAEEIRDFAGESPAWWAYYGAYDWVALCQLYGTMMDLPKGWPMHVMDVKQLCVERGNPTLPRQVGVEHYALADARWTRKAWAALQHANPEWRARGG